MSSYRPRRTRVYDCNYNAGEQYYKSALDNLDKKYSAAPSIAERIAARKQTDTFGGDDDLFSARQRAGKVISENSIFDTRSGKLHKPMVEIDDDIDEQVNQPIKISLDRIRANKKNITNMMEDLDVDDQIASMKRKAKQDFSQKFDSLDDDFSSSTFRKSSGMKALKARADDIIESNTLSNWNTAVDEIKSGASNRARASKARLDELETDMFERSEKQAARDKRSVHLKKFLSDTEFDSNENNSQMARLSSSKIEKKIVSF
jgi:hypothetical protein